MFEPVDQTPTYRDGIKRAADEVRIVCDRLDKSSLGEAIAEWLLRLPDDPKLPHPETPTKRRSVNSRSAS